MCYNNVNNNATTTAIKIAIHTLIGKCFSWCYVEPSPALLSPQVGDFIVWVVEMFTLTWFWFGFFLMFARIFHAFLSLHWSAVLLYPNSLEILAILETISVFSFLPLFPVSSRSMSDLLYLWNNFYSKCLCLCQAGASSPIFHVCTPLHCILSLHFSRPLLTQ